MKRQICFFIVLLTYPLLSNGTITTKDYQFISFGEGTNSQMTLHQLASYCAPIFWFSPDEPELQNKELRGFGWGILYSPSASRFMDPYISAGVEVDKFLPRW